MANGPNHINFLVRGTDDPTLIFVHGFACSLDDWEEQFTTSRDSVFHPIDGGSHHFYGNGLRLR
jgi:pimeloyl-ACP methyl ester carboxylesterase